MFLVRVGDSVVILNEINGTKHLSFDKVIRDTAGKLTLAKNNFVNINPTKRTFDTPTGLVKYAVDWRDCSVDPFLNKISTKTAFYDPLEDCSGYFVWYGGDFLYIYTKIDQTDYFLCYKYLSQSRTIGEVLVKESYLIGQTIFEPVDKNIITGLIFFEGLTPPPKKTYPSGITLSPIANTNPPQSGGVYNPSTIYMDIRPGEELPFIKKKAGCSHPNKKVVRLIQSAYLYCPDCKADLGDVK